MLLFAAPLARDLNDSEPIVSSLRKLKLEAYAQTSEAVSSRTSAGHVPKEAAELG